MISEFSWSHLLMVTLHTCADERWSPREMFSHLPPRNVKYLLHRKFQPWHRVKRRRQVQISPGDLLNIEYGWHLAVDWYDRSPHLMAGYICRELNTFSRMFTLRIVFASLLPLPPASRICLLFCCCSRENMKGFYSPDLKESKVVLRVAEETSSS